MIYFKFNVEVDALPEISPDDSRYNEPFFAFRVIDQAGNEYYQQETYAQFIAPGSRFFGVNRIADIEKKLADVPGSGKTISFNLIPNQVSTLANGEPAIELRVTSLASNIKQLDWTPLPPELRAENAPSIIYRDGEQITISFKSRYVDKNVPEGKSPIYRITQEGKDGNTYSSTEIVPERSLPGPAFYGGLFTESNFVRIPAGEFDMGSEDGYDSEKPVHKVRISRSFYMGKYEVTQAQWIIVMGNNPSYFKGERLPVEQVSWDDAQTFINKLNEKYGEKVFRLPTEAEWEYVCRTGTNTPFSTGENLTTSQANYDGNYPYKNYPKGKYLEKTSVVGSYAPNKWGLYDMHGNVLEWCQDWYSRDYYATCKQQGTVADPMGPANGSGRVLRGGSWGYDAHLCRSANRSDATSDRRYHNIGFRLVFVPQSVGSDPSYP